MKIEEFSPTYNREDGLSALYGRSVPFPLNFTPMILESGIINFPINAKGGNHKHPRIESFYSTGDLTIIWVDTNGKKRSESMKPNKQIYKLFTTDPYEAHAIINESLSEQILIEYASEPQRDVEIVNII